MNYWLRKALIIAEFMKDNKYKTRLRYLTIIQRFFIKMYFRSLIRDYMNRKTEIINEFITGDIYDKNSV